MMILPVNKPQQQMLHFIWIAVILSFWHIRDFPITQPPKQLQ